MGIMAKVKEMETQFKNASSPEDKQKVLSGFKEFSMTEQGLYDLPKKDRDFVWSLAYMPNINFHEVFLEVGSLGRKVKDGSLN